MIFFPTVSWILLHKRTKDRIKAGQIQLVWVGLGRFVEG